MCRDAAPGRHPSASLGAAAGASSLVDPYRVVSHITEPGCQGLKGQVYEARDGFPYGMAVQTYAGRSDVPQTQQHLSIFRRVLLDIPIQ